MLGVLRFTLAIAVVIYHLNPAFAAFSGGLAVFGFYTVSGFLVARILDETYQGRPIDYLINRALRIYPAYWVVAVAGAVLASSEGSHLNPAIALPGSVAETVPQFTIFGLLQVQGGPIAIRLVPPAWSLNMEIVWYLVMIMAVRHLRTWLMVGLAVAVWTTITNDAFVAYNTFIGPTFCFALGAAGHHYRDKLPAVPSWLAWPLLAGLMAVSSYFVNQVWILFLASGFTFLVILTPRSRGAASLSIDRWAGALAYPIFLCHWHVATLTGMERGWPLFLTSLPLILGASLLLVMLVERPVEQHLRRRIRERQASALAA
jgi:peptidoglycan/LPS O-acetylase OafA/YrhL